MMDEQDVKSAGNTPIMEVFSELRDRTGILKTSVILVGSLLNRIKVDKSYKEKGHKSLNDYMNSIGLSVEMGLSLMQTADVLESRFPEAYRNLKDGVDGTYLPGKKAINIASRLESVEGIEEDFTKPTSIQKLKQHMQSSDKIGKDGGLPIDKIAKSSKVFTKKVLDCEDIPEATKSGMSGVNQKIQELKDNTDGNGGDTQ